MNVTMNELIDVIGKEAAFRLVEAFGGVKVYVPLPCHLPGHPLEAVLGPQAARLAAEFARIEICVPKGRDQVIELRNREIIRRSKAGETVKTLALSYNLSERHIWNIRRKMRDGESSQPVISR